MENNMPLVGKCADIAMHGSLGANTQPGGYFGQQGGMAMGENEIADKAEGVQFAF